jgi:transcriptional regulator with XRE-family HTH domain
LARGSEVSRVKRVRDRYGLKQPEMSRLLGVSARTLSELESQPKEPRQETKRRLTEVERLYRALSEIIDADGIAAWMQEPNDGFDGSTPLQVVERGEIDRIWQMIYAVRTGHPS